MPKKNRSAAKTPTRSDVYLGERIREARIAQHMLQQELASLIGVSYQQLQKYESGKNRVTTARIELLVTALNRPLAYFMPNATDVRAQPDPVFSAMMASKEGQTLLHAFARTASQKRRRMLVDLAVELSQEAK
jgi:transcriptional regulator with XRE-family HTH domain